MRILLLNPNTTTAITDLLLAAACSAAAPGTDIVPVTAQRGVPYIATRAEAQIGGVVALEVLAEHHQGFDAAIIAAFGDPGLGGARELFPLPIVGLAEASMLLACTLGRTFSIVTFAAALEPWYRECVAWHGLSQRCASIRTLETRFASVDDVQNEKESDLVALASRTIEQDGADVIVLAGAPLAGLAPRVRDRIPVPVVECTAAAVKFAEALVTLAPRKATVGTFKRPAPKPATGVAPALARWLAHD
ncbi:MAG: aspartate/glutamate racemase family protein [Hyphomicrobiaceae bacterium]